MGIKSISLCQLNVEIVNLWFTQLTILLLLFFLSLWFYFVSSVYAAKKLWTEAQRRRLCGCRCHLLMSAVMMWGGEVYLETPSQSQDSIISFRQNKVRQRQLWTSQQKGREREKGGGMLSSETRSLKTFEVVTNLWWKNAARLPVWVGDERAARFLSTFDLFTFEQSSGVQLK